MEQIQDFRQLGSKTPGHPEYGDTPGVELTTGPLGQGFAHGVGMALAGRLTASQYAQEGAEGGPGTHFVYGIVSDGDLMEGISAEAGSIAGHLGLGNLIYLYDDNHITIDGRTEITFGEDVRGRFEAQGWHVEQVDGADVEGLHRAIEAARAERARPSLIMTRTIIGQGSPNKADTSGVHGSPLGPEELQASKQAADWPLEPEFLVPDAVRTYLAERIETKKAVRAERDAELASWRQAAPERHEAWQAARERRLPENLAATLAAEVEGQDKATRQTAAAVLQKLSGELVPYLVGGSADLAGSGAPPIIKQVGDVGPKAGDGVDPFAGRNLYFGVREHAMAAISNGIALDGTFLPYCGTFLQFSDYMRPAIRLAALMKVKTIFVFTHDSIFLGEDGPTHQPIEQLDALRAIPGFRVFRPADGVEAAHAYAWILERAEGPAMLALSRQGVPALDRPAGFDTESVARGAYELRGTDGVPDVVLLATGSEVSLACAAAEKLSAGGLQARVVSVPCLELFLEQPAAYREGLLPEGVPAVAVEASRGLGFWQLVGGRGFVYGIDRFGASAPIADLAEDYGFTPDALSQRVLDFVRR
jgi:transketolase